MLCLWPGNAILLLANQGRPDAAWYWRLDPFWASSTRHVVLPSLLTHVAPHPLQPHQESGLARGLQPWPHLTSPHKTSTTQYDYALTQCQLCSWSSEDQLTTPAWVLQPVPCLVQAPPAAAIAEPAQSTAKTANSQPIPSAAKPTPASEPTPASKEPPQVTWHVLFSTHVMQRGETVSSLGREHNCMCAQGGPAAPCRLACGKA